MHHLYKRQSEHMELLDTHRAASREGAALSKAEMQMWLNKYILNLQRLEFNCSKDQNCYKSGRSHASQY